MLLWYNSWLWGPYSRFWIKVTACGVNNQLQSQHPGLPHEFVIRGACPQRTSARKWSGPGLSVPCNQTRGSPSTRLPRVPLSRPVAKRWGPECSQHFTSLVSGLQGTEAFSPFQDLPMPGPGWLGVSSRTSSLAQLSGHFLSGAFSESLTQVRFFCPTCLSCGSLSLFTCGIIFKLVSYRNYTYLFSSVHSVPGTK